MNSEQGFTKQLHRCKPTKSTIIQALSLQGFNGYIQYIFTSRGHVTYSIVEERFLKLHRSSSVPTFLPVMILSRFTKDSLASNNEQAVLSTGQCSSSAFVCSFAVHHAITTCHFMLPIAKPSQSASAHVKGMGGT